MKKLVNPLPKADRNRESLARHNYPYGYDGLTVEEQKLADNVRNTLNEAFNHEPSEPKVPKDVKQGVKQFATGKMNDERFAARCNVIDHELHILELWHSEYGAQNWHTIPDHEVNIIHRFWVQTLREMHLP